MRIYKTVAILTAITMLGSPAVYASDLSDVETVANEAVLENEDVVFEDIANDEPEEYVIEDDSIGESPVAEITEDSGEGNDEVIAEENAVMETSEETLEEDENEPEAEAGAIIPENYKGDVTTMGTYITNSRNAAKILVKLDGMGYNASTYITPTDAQVRIPGIPFGSKVTIVWYDSANKKIATQTLTFTKNMDAKTGLFQLSGAAKTSKLAEVILKNKSTGAVYSYRYVKAIGVDEFSCEIPYGKYRVTLTTGTGISDSQRFTKVYDDTFEKGSPYDIEYGGYAMTGDAPIYDYLNLTYTPSAPYAEVSFSGHGGTQEYVYRGAGEIIQYGSLSTYKVTVREGNSADTAIQTINSNVSMSPTAFDIRFVKYSDYIKNGAVQKINGGNFSVPKMKLSVKFGGDKPFDGTLKEGTDYKVTYKINSNNTLDVTYTGMGRFAKSRTFRYPITPKAITDSFVNLATAYANYAYTGTARNPAPIVTDGNKTLTKGTDYTVSYKNNTNVGTATVTVKGIGCYKGSRSATFKIRYSLKDADVTATTKSASYVYTGSARKPGVTVKRGTKTLVNGTDYTLAYKDNTNVGTATITITGKGNYMQTKTITFKLTAKDINDSSVTAKTASASYAYTGKPRQPNSIVKDGSKTLTKGTDYTVTYANNTNKGTATLTIKGKGNYKGSRVVKFKIT